MDFAWGPVGEAKTLWRGKAPYLAATPQVSFWGVFPVDYMANDLIADFFELPAKRFLYGFAY